MRKAFLWCSIAGIIALVTSCNSAPPGNNDSKSRSLALSENGRSEYVIVQPETPSETDKFAVRELSNFLRQATGAEYKIETAEKAEGKKRIYVGLSSPALKVLGSNPLEGMEDQEHVSKNVGEDIFLYGKGVHGNLHAVYDFLENSIGLRFLSAFAEPTMEEQKSLSIKQFSRQGKPSFKVREMYSDKFYHRPGAMLHLYRNKSNFSIARHCKDIPGIVDIQGIIPPTCHTLFSYIPPHETVKKGLGANPPLKHLKNKNYFDTNPEFFSMSKEGKRVDNLHLCLSNKNLRKELTKNIKENIRISGGKGVLTVEANDIPGKFCYCPECAKLEEKYSCIGGPLFDYLIELCGELKNEHPEVFVKSLVYRKEQTQKPPKIDRLPDNMIPIFAPIDDNFAADWSHPTNAETYSDLKEWCRLAKNVWVWYYPNPYGGNQPPLGNIERIVNDFRLMKKAGVSGLFIEHDVGVTEGLGFTELQTYLMLKLMQDTEQDAEKLVSEFMAAQYGKAAPMMRQYLSELETCRKEMKTFLPWNPSFAMFTCVTPDRLLKWEKDFDKMESLTADNPATLFNVRQVRTNLDVASLQAWQKAKKIDHEYFKDPKTFAKRIRETYDRMIKEHVSASLASNGKNMQKTFHTNLDTLMLFAENGGKPLPQKFAEIKEENIRRIVPRSGQKEYFKDADAAFGIAGESKVEKPFKIGFYDASNKKFVLSRAIQESEIKAGQYHIYKLGQVELTPDCLLWLSDWHVAGRLESAYEPGVANKWTAYVSIKFEGPSYEKEPKIKADRILCDQIVLVREN